MRCLEHLRGLPWPRRAAMPWLSAAVGLALAGCQHRRAAPSGGSVAIAPMPLPPLRAPSVELKLPSPDRQLDPNWLELDSFFPPGARRVGPVQPLNAELAPMRRTQFPTTELCPSPNEQFVLFHDGMKRKQPGIFHWLMLLKNEPRAYPNTILGTMLTFEASWSEDSARFAVTHFVGDNSSEVFVVDTADLERKPVAVQPFIAAHFPPHFAAMPMFLKAYRWTHDGQLVVRAIARSREEPYELYGCEIAARFPGPGAEPETRYLRGYIKPQAADPTP
jgi:hypothetical protein